jgi:transcriptional regulator with XRE-family HTH domain
MAREVLTMSQVVGMNVERLRRKAKLTQEELRRKLLNEQAVQMSRPTIAQLEAGKRPTSVDELFALSLVLGVAPHVLMYPPSGTGVGATAQGGFRGRVIADWLWDPDGHRFSEAGEVEQRWWFESAELAERLPADELIALARKVGAEEDQQTDRVTRDQAKRRKEADRMAATGKYEFDFTDVVVPAAKQPARKSRKQIGEPTRRRKK